MAARARQHLAFAGVAPEPCAGPTSAPASERLRMADVSERHAHRSACARGP